MLMCCSILREFVRSCWRRAIVIARARSPLLKATVYTQVMRSPLAPLKKGEPESKSPFLRGMLQGISEDFGSTQRCVYTPLKRVGQEDHFALKTIAKKSIT